MRSQFFTCSPCSEDDTIGDLKKLVAAQTGTRPEKIRIQKWYTIYKVSKRHAEARLAWACTRPHHTSSSYVQDHITLADYEVHDGMGLELYYN